MADRAIEIGTGDDAHEMRRFLGGIALDGGKSPPHSKNIPICTRAQDKARKRAKRLGLVRFEDRLWVLTERGRAIADGRQEVANG